MKKYVFYGNESCGGITARKEKYKGISAVFDLYDALESAWSRETCTPRLRSEWCETNLTVGQCAVTAFVTQDIFGGEVYGIPTDNGGVHCFNVVDGVTFDLTSEQFGGKKLDYSSGTLQSRAVHFERCEKRERYEMLCRKLETLTAKH